MDSGDDNDIDLKRDPLIGTLVGRYIVQEKIGHGGMGAVYSILQPAIHKKLALKLLHQEYAGRKEIVQRFFDEARAVNLIGHPNIVDITDFSHLPDGRPFIIMEYLDGQSLEEYLEGKGPLETSDILSILKQLTSALGAAHAKHIFHRDLKPENVFLSTHPEGGLHLKVLDFGIAKLADQEFDDTRATQTGVVLGTPTYMSPEQATGNSQQADHRTDIYSLGIILYELLAGEPPFSGQSFAELIMKHIQAEVPNICLLRTELSTVWNDVIVKAMAKDPRDRFQSMQELYAATEQATRLPARAAAKNSADQAMPTAQLPPKADIGRKSFARKTDVLPGKFVGGMSPIPEGLASAADKAAKEFAGTADEAAKEFAGAADEAAKEFAGTAANPALKELARATAAKTADGIDQDSEDLANARRTEEELPSAARAEELPSTEEELPSAERAEELPSKARAEELPSKARAGLVEAGALEKGLAGAVATKQLANAMGAAEAGAAEDPDLEETAIAITAPLPVQTPHSNRAAKLIAASAVLFAGIVATIWVTQSSPNTNEEQTVNGPTLVNTHLTHVIDAGVTSKPIAVIVDASPKKEVILDASLPDAGAATPTVTIPPDAGATAPVHQSKRGHGILDVRSTPWAAVYLDGKRIGGTPLKRKLSPGRHRVRLHNDYLGQKKRYSFSIKAGGTHTINEYW